MDIVLTTAGIQAVINAKETGTNAVTISEIGVGTGKYTPTKAHADPRRWASRRQRDSRRVQG